MNGKGAIEYLKGLCERIDTNQTMMTLKKTAVVASLPIAASFTVACYGAPEPDPYYEDTDALCSDGMDNDDDGAIDCADAECNGLAMCGTEVCDDDYDNDGDGQVDCDDSDCSSDPSCQISYKLPDTGLTKCYDTAQEITCPQQGEPFYGQDAQYGPNLQSYTKLDENSNELPDDAPWPWAMVRDNVTGLIWEVKQDNDGIQNYENPHDADNTYTLYFSNIDCFRN